MKVSNQPNSARGAGTTAVKKKKKLTTPAKVIIAITAVLLAGCIVMGGLVWRKYARIQSAQGKANDLYTPVTENEADDPSSHEVIDDTPAVVDPSTGVVSDFNSLFEENDDTIGHISIPGTKLSTPVVQGDDNVYYLDHNFFRESTLGVPFADFRASISQDYTSNNVTIYGHAAKDGSYFAPIKEYRTLEYYKQHPVINFDTIFSGKGRYKIIGALIAKVNNGTGTPNDPEEFNYHDYVNMSEEDFDTYIDEVLKRSYFDTGVDVKYGDQLITLSTCDDEIEDSLTTPYRMIVVARKVRPGESTEVDLSAASENTDMLMPQAWVDKYKKSNPYQ